MNSGKPSDSSEATPNSRPASLTAGIEDTSQFLWNVQKYINDYLRFGDTKAALSVATVSAIIGALFKVDAQSSFRSGAILSNCSAWFSLIAFASLGLSAVLGIIAVTPPFRQRRTRGLMYWNEIAAHGNESEYWNAVREQSVEELTRSLSRHIFTVSNVCRYKYRLIQGCIVLGLVGAVFAALFALNR
jgi:hypothetical protein